MAQWINVFWNNSFVNPTRLPLLCRNSRAVALAEPGLTAGWLAVRRNAGKFQIFKIRCRSNFYTFCCVQQCYSVIRAIGMHFSWYFQRKSVLRWLLEV